MGSKVPTDLEKISVKEAINRAMRIRVRYYTAVTWPKIEKD